MGDEAKPKKSFFKIVFGTAFGLFAGAGTVYFNTAFNAVVRPSKPVANFSVAGTDGLTANFSVKATGDSGWWDFGDGSELQPFDPAQPTVSHAYPKPGSYSAKLIVRNFLSDENDRSVTVDLSAPAAATAAAGGTQPPKLLGIQVTKLSDTVPAAYRITGEVQNADEVVWAAGERREHVAVQSGLFEKYVTIDKAGPAAIVLTALSKAKATPDVFVHPVTVTNPTTAAFDVRLDVQDVVSRTASVTRREMMPLSTRDAQGKPAAGFSRVLAAAPGATIKAAELDTRQMRQAGAVKNVKAQVAADGKTVTLTGEFDKGVATADVFAPVLLTEERTTATSPGRNTPLFLLQPVAGGRQEWQGSMKLPPAAPGTQRKVNLVLEYTKPTGERIQLATTALDAGKPWTAPVTQLGSGFGVLATMVDGEVRVTVGNPAPAAPTGGVPAATAPAPTPPAARPTAPVAPAPTKPVAPPAKPTK